MEKVIGLEEALFVVDAVPTFAEFVAELTNLVQIWFPKSLKFHTWNHLRNSTDQCSLAVTPWMNRMTMRKLVTA